MSYEDPTEAYNVKKWYDWIFLIWTYLTIPVMIYLAYGMSQVNKDIAVISVRLDMESRMEARVYELEKIANANKNRLSRLEVIHYHEYPELSNEGR